MASKLETKPTGGIGLDILKRWFAENKRANPQGWMDSIVELLRSQPPKGFHTGPMRFNDQRHQVLRKWVLENFSEV